MNTITIKKALLWQSLFFCWFTSAQTLRIDRPVPGEPLETVQRFEITTDETVKRLEFHLNGRLIQARTRPPFHFDISWNTRLENKVLLIAFLPDGRRERLEQRFAQVEADFEADVKGLQCFPFPDRPYAESRWRLRADDQPIEPDTLETADGRFPLDIVIALDVSGSMRSFLKPLSPTVRAIMLQAVNRGHRARLVVFDHKPSIPTSGAITGLEAFYQGQGSSVIWDTLATSADLFDRGPRRVLLLISDGADDGSRHDAVSAATYLQTSRAALIWLNPEYRPNRTLSQLVTLSGGFELNGTDETQASILLKALSLQVHLFAAKAQFPIRLDIKPGRVFYPQWREAIRP